MSIEETVRSIVVPLADDEMVEVVDVEHKGATLRITVDQAPDGIGTEALARVTRAISRAMDEHEPLPGQYTLEVSSPGLERPLRTADHFTRAIGEQIKVKTSVEVHGQRRFEGELVEVDGDEIVVDLDEPLAVDSGDDEDGGDAPSSPSEEIAEIDTIRIPIADVAKARTVFEWGPAPKPGSPEAVKAAKKKKKKQEKRSQRQESGSDRDANDDASAEAKSPEAENSAQTSEKTGAVGS